MQIFYVHMVLAAAGIIWHVVASLRIADFIQKRGEKVNWFLIRLYLPSYVGKYRKLTRADYGHSGPLFWQFIVSINGALLFAVLAILIKKGVLH